MEWVDVSKEAHQPGTRRRRVLFVLPSLGGGGLERVTISLLHHLDRSRFEPHLALLGKVGPYVKEVPEDVPVHDLKVFRVRYSIPALVRLIRKLRPQAVLSTPRELNMAMGFVRPWLPHDLRLLVAEHNLVTEELAEKSPYFKTWRWLYRHYYIRADRIICVADYILNELAERFAVPRNKMVRIYNPVDVGRVRLLAHAGENPYSAPGPHLVAVGRLSRQKGFDLLLDAMALVHKTVPDVQLTIVGQGSLESDLKNQRDQLSLTDAVHFVGFQPNPYPYFKHADVFVLSSRYEGMPVVLLEALALGTFVVATDCPGGVREILTRCTGGLLVPDLDARSLAEMIVMACDSNRKSTSNAEDLAELVDKFRIERIIGAYEDLFSI